jgi:hypothetical protein
MGVSDYIIKDEYKERFRQIIRKPQNFFKHANRDPGDSSDFNPEVTPFFIYDAVQKYQEITGESVVYFRIFRGWYCTQNLDMFFVSDENKRTYTQMKQRYGTDRLLYFSDMLEVSGILK